MSVIANYVRVSEDQLNDWRSNPDLLQAIYEERVDRAEHCDVDKAYEAIAWLLSPVKREEQRRRAAAWPDTSDLDPDDSEAWAEAFDNQPPVDFSGLEPDLFLTAIEGRASDDRRDARIQCGLDPACVFPPDFVRKISESLGSVTPEQFREHFSPRIMAEQRVEPDIWDGGRAILSDFLRPAFKRLRGFYGRAAAAEQHVVVFFT